MASERKKRKVIKSENREIIARVYNFLREEFKFTELYNDPNCDISHLRNVSKRTAEATGVSLRSVQKILQEAKQLPSTSSKFPEPLKNRRKRSTKVDINERIAYGVRSTLHDIYMVRRQVMPVEKIKTILAEKHGFDGCVQTLRKLLKKMNYVPRKTSNKAFWHEHHDVQMARLQYLKMIKQYRSEGRNIVYADETYVVLHHRNHAKDCRFVLVYAGADNGFIDDASLIVNKNAALPQNQKLTFEQYVQWLDDKLLPNIPKTSVLVLESDSLRVKDAEEVPAFHADKSEMQAWLVSKGIPFPADLRQIELYDLIKKHKSTYTTDKIDHYIQSKGFEVLRVPPNHPELNAILYIWETLKSEIFTVEPNISDTEPLINECISKITSESWRSTCDLVIQRETEYMDYFDTGLNLSGLSVQNANSDEETGSEEHSSFSYDSS